MSQRRHPPPRCMHQLSASGEQKNVVYPTDKPCKSTVQKITAALRTFLQHLPHSDLPIYAGVLTNSGIINDCPSTIALSAVWKHKNSSKRQAMKLILAVIQPPKLDAVQQALQRIGVTRLTIVDAMGFARQRGQSETYRGAEYRTNLLRKVAIEIAVNDDFVERTIECLEQVARTGQEGGIGDGKIFILPMDESIQISDSRRGPGAV